tara:strand:+ start:238 stop:984 length:747 start_codon:yes stop_codon:yes gene_type:complete
MATHFKGPILYSAARKGLENLQVGVWPDQAVLYDDFTGILLDATNDWTVVKDSGATAAISADTATGVLALTSQATTDDDGASIQGNEIFQLPSTAGEKLFFESRFFASTTAGSGVGQMDIWVGLTENFATAPENAFLATNRIGFQLDDGSSLTRLISESGGTETETELAAAYNLTDDTYVTLGFIATKGTSTDTVQFYYNRQLVGTHTTNVPTALLTPAAVEVSGDATGTKSLNVDYIMAAVDRGVTY